MHCKPQKPGHPKKFKKSPLPGYGLTFFFSARNPLKLPHKLFNMQRPAMLPGIEKHQKARFKLNCRCSSSSSWKASRYALGNDDYLL